MILTSSAALVLLTACGGGSSGSDAGPSVSTTADGARPTKAVSASSLSECVVGDWSVDPASYDSVMAAMLGDSEMAPTVTSKGTSTTSFAADGTFVTSTDLTMTFAMETLGQKVVSTAVSSGTQKGTWSADEKTLTSTITDDNVKTSTTVTLNGEEQPVPDQTDGQDFGAGGLPEIPVPAACTASTLTLTLDLASIADAVGQTATDAPTFSIVFTRN
jgi:hypothetical protein